MSQQQVIAVTGATGGIGGRVAARLAAAGVRQRLIVRDAARAPEHPGAEVRTVPGGYADTAGLTAALTGASTLLLVSAAEAEDRVAQHVSAVQAAAGAGITHVVYLSFLGAAPDATFTLARDHHHTEAAVREHGLGFTFLRDSLYLDFVPGMVGADGVLRGPAGSKGRVGAVARKDVADAAAAVLLDPAPHAGVTYDLTGPEAFTLPEAAATMSDVCGRPITFHHESVQEAFESRMDPAVPDFMIDAWVTTYLAIRDGELATVSSAVQDLTGHAPRGLREVLEAHPGCLDHVRAS
ncbi:MAG: Nitrogen transcription regulator, NmrA family [Solirubrobacterales bacterium]|nr:Nitrogen transcription regulator, NmrA family [Solirubrobacterales bacterium]